MEKVLPPLLFLLLLLLLHFFHSLFYSQRATWTRVAGTIGRAKAKTAGKATTSTATIRCCFLSMKTVREAHRESKRERGIGREEVQERGRKVGR